MKVEVRVIAYIGHNDERGTDNFAVTDGEGVYSCITNTQDAMNALCDALDNEKTVKVDLYTERPRFTYKWKRKEESK